VNTTRFFDGWMIYLLALFNIVIYASIAVMLFVK
jgi:hypothetical protein